MEERRSFVGFINYGVLAKEKRQVWTAEAPASTATTSDKVEITVPEGWTMYELASGDFGVTAPWGWDYRLNDVLGGNENPYFIVLDDSGKRHSIKLEWKEITGGME